ncbi:MAG: hypothetical protein JO233_09865, partial [Candidatus Eremiobacteraeota bacterium]|nr:hypothetical protein [Candidatus Eremiobacteraeota bacterium]
RLDNERKTRALTERDGFVGRLQLVQDFRKFLYIDPGLPSALLSAHWPGSVASGLFRQYYALIAPKAERFFKAALQGALAADPVPKKLVYSSPS